MWERITVKCGRSYNRGVRENSNRKNNTTCSNTANMKREQHKSIQFQNGVW